MGRGDASRPKVPWNAPLVRRRARRRQPAALDGWPSVTPLRHNRPHPIQRAMPAQEPPDVKLVAAIVHNEDAANLVDALLEREFRATRLHSSGGFLKQGNATILVGVEDEQVDAVLEVISANCHSRRQFVNPMPPIMEPGEFYM